MVEPTSSTRLLFVAAERANLPALIARMNTPLTDQYDLVTSQEQYEALEDKYSYDILVIFWGPDVAAVINDQSMNSSRVKFAQALSAGVDAYVKAEHFRDNENIALYNVKGAFSHVLGEYVALGMLYFSKHVEHW